MILARHAEALLWTGRYLERAETTSRCLNYAANSITHLRGDEARAEGELMVRTLGLQEELEAVGPLESQPQLVAFLLSDTDNPGSVVSAVIAVRENLRSVRDRIPIELWEEANGLYLRFPFLGHANAPPGGLHEVLLMVRRACLAVSGILNEGMRRDEGHAFVVVGRMLERSIFTVGLLEASHSDARGVMDATRMLRLTSSLQAYHRQHGNAPDPDGVVRYLLHAPDLPRSVLSCLSRAGEGLTGLGANAPALDRARRKAALLRARLELGEVEEAMASAPVATLQDFSVQLAGLAGDVHAGIVPPLAMATVQAQYVRPGQAGEPGHAGERARPGPGGSSAAGGPGHAGERA
ncbi:MAG: alpha-E domain-containing protein [Acidimicrobiaceae bacterium]|nr:alpha-E domain-containing protein [Acidimicrobiaceae bacterium]